MFGIFESNPEAKQESKTHSSDTVYFMRLEAAVKALEGWPDLLVWSSEPRNQAKLVDLWVEAKNISDFRLFCAEAALASANETSRKLGEQLTAAYKKLQDASASRDSSQVAAAHKHLTDVSVAVKAAISDEANADDLVERMQKEIAEEKKRSADPSFSEAAVSYARSTLAGWVLAATTKK